MLFLRFPDDDNYEDCRLLGCDAVYFNTQAKTFQRNLLSPSPWWQLKDSRYLRDTVNNESNYTASLPEE
jgi:hypothetical protein